MTWDFLWGMLTGGGIVIVSVLAGYFISEKSSK